MSETDWDAAFDNMGTIPDAMGYVAKWEADAAAYRASGVQVETALPYGTKDREVFDVVVPKADPKGLVVFVHGGFWMRLSKDYWTHLAEGARAQGYAVAIPGYTLAPDARISQITRQISKAVEAAATHIAGPIHLAGHSAGGHLVTRMISDSSPLNENVAARITSVLSISGLHDLDPLRHTKMNDILQLDAVEAAAESSALLKPNTSAKVTAWVGGGELPEFLRQTHMLEQRWTDHCQISSVTDGGFNHFSVLDALSDPQSDIVRALL